MYLHYAEIEMTIKLGAGQGTIEYSNYVFSSLIIVLWIDKEIVHPRDQAAVTRRVTAGHPLMLNQVRLMILHEFCCFLYDCFCLPLLSFYHAAAELSRGCAFCIDIFGGY